jgi:virginiamycin B lyase
MIPTKHLYQFSKNETFTEIKIPSAGANVRQILGVPGEIWRAESGTDKIISIKTGP